MLITHMSLNRRNNELKKFVYCLSGKLFSLVYLTNSNFARQVKSTNQPCYDVTRRASLGTNWLFSKRVSL